MITISIQIFFQVTRQRLRYNRLYGITKFCRIQIRQNIQKQCLQHLQATLNRLKPGSINRRRKTICSTLLFDVDGTVKDFGNDFIPQPPQQSQEAIVPVDVPIDAPVTTDDTPQKSSTKPTSQASKPQNTLQEPYSAYINPFQRTKGGFQLFGRRHSTHASNQKQ